MQFYVNFHSLNQCFSCPSTRIQWGTRLTGNLPSLQFATQGDPFWQKDRVLRGHKRHLPRIWWVRDGCLAKVMTQKVRWRRHRGLLRPREIHQRLSYQSLYLFCFSNDGDWDETRAMRRWVCEETEDMAILSWSLRQHRENAVSEGDLGWTEGGLFLKSESSGFQELVGRSQGRESVWKYASTISREISEESQSKGKRWVEN